MLQPPGLPDASQWLAGLLQDSARLSTLQADYAEKQARLWTAMVQQRGEEPVAAPAPGDRRFASSEWRDNAYYSYLKQSYLLASRYLNELAEGAPLEPRARERLRFAVQQWCDAMCPANFAVTNPSVLREALATKGESLTQGLANLIADTRRGRISQSDESAFEVGRNLALSPGQVVFQNDLIQLIQYTATTPKVGARPLVMIPPCINKFYILDLQPANSFVRYAVEQGHTVFMVSWRNVGPEQGHYGWDDYIESGVLKALEVSKQISQSDKVNALGFCVGGTLLATALAVLAQKKQDVVESVTYLATMLDFEEPGQIRAFIDEDSLAAREAQIGENGILPGSDLALAFNALRANDLVWNYVVGNYLMGGSPAAFDLLYWNGDSTNLPGPMYCSYVRNTYLENCLREPGALENCGVPVDLGKVDRPSFIVATREDHIVPWRMAYRSLGLLGGEKQFVLGASGHIAGIVNPPAGGKRSYWESAETQASADGWLKNAVEHKGSWWPRWSAWLAAYKGGERDAPAAEGNSTYRPIEAAPGSYVGQKAN